MKLYVLLLTMGLLGANAQGMYFPGDDQPSPMQEATSLFMLKCTPIMTGYAYPTTASKKAAIDEAFEDMKTIYRGKQQILRNLSVEAMRLKRTLQ